MKLSHAVLAAVYYGGLLAAALPEPAYYDYVGAEEYNVPQEEAWTVPQMQRIMDLQRAGMEFGNSKQVPVELEPDRRPGEPHRGSPPPATPRPPFPGHPPPEHPDHPPPHRPGPPHEPPPGAPNFENLTIYQFLESRKDFSRLFKVVNFTEDAVSVLNDTSANVTFFALPDWAFPHRPHHKGEPHHLFDTENIGQDDLLDALAAAEGLVHIQDDKDDEDRKKFLKAVLKAILKYETLPSALPVSELAKNVTYATSLALPDGSLDGESLRVRIAAGPGLFSPHVAVNFVSKIVHRDIKTANGLVHVVNRPVLPPPSIFQIGFLFPDSFSTLTSALQRVGLTDAVEWRDVHGSDGKHTVDGSPAVTFFAPTNKAFSRLPWKLRFFLFSPFGERVLKKLLQFHIVPELVLHADYIHNATESDATPARRAWEEDQAWDVYGNLVHNDNMLEPQDESAPIPACSKFMNISSGRFPGAVRTPEQFSGWPSMPARNPLAHRLKGAPPPPPPPPPPHHDGPHDPWAPHPPPHGHGHEHSPFPPPPPPPPFEHGPHHHHHGHGPLPPPPPPFEHGPPHHHGHFFPPPPEIHYHYHYHGPSPPPPPHHHDRPSEGPHFPPEHGPHFPEHGPHPPPPPPPPHHPPFEHFPERAPHFPEDGPHPPPPPPPPHHPPFEHGPHFPEPGPPPPPGGEGPHGPARPHSRVVHSRNLTHPTLLANHSLNLHVIQVAHTIPLPHHPRTFYQTATFAHGTAVKLSDVPTRNGVLHIVDRLINPRWKPSDHPPHGPPGPPKEGEEGPFMTFAEDVGGEDEWAGWEEWLVRWADEE